MEDRDSIASAVEPRRVTLDITSPYTNEVQRIPLTRPLVAGRLPECDVRLVDPRVSRRHARVSLTDVGRLLVEDLGSANGTGAGSRMLRGESLVVPVPAVIHIEPFVLVLRYEDGDAEATLRGPVSDQLRVRSLPDGLEIEGVLVQATPLERRLLEILAVRYPDPAHHAEIADGVWGGGQWAPYMLQNLVRRCRVRLRAAHLAAPDPIESIRGYGYRLVLAAPPVPPAPPDARE